MRTKQKHDAADCPAYVDHPHADELREIDRIIGESPDLCELVRLDLIRGGIAPDRGRGGMSARQVLGAAVAYHLSAPSFEDLAFRLKDSASYRRFCRIPDADDAPAESTLHENVSKITALTWQAIGDILVRRAAREDIEDGTTVRSDCTVCESNIHPPTDISLCLDVVRTGSRLLEQAAEGRDISYTDHTLRASRRVLEFRNASEDERKDICRDLLSVTENTLADAASALEELDRESPSRARKAGSSSRSLEGKLSELLERGHTIVDQTRRRILEGESGPASEKIVSLFEPHTDIIVTSDGDVQFGHKLALTTGASSMILDVMVLDGNPSDSNLCELLVERLTQTYGRAPNQVAFDGGFASRDNLESLKDTYEIDDVAFHKKRGLAEDDMASSRRVYRQLRKFRAGIEGIISWLKHTLGLERCRWTSGLEGFRAYVHGAVISANLLTMARHRLERRPG